MLDIKVWRDPYESGFNTTKPKQVSFNPGLTILVGCNGAGKSTLLMNIEEQCRKDKIPYSIYDNLRNGGWADTLGAALGGFAEFDDDLEFGTTMWQSSEGETIKANIGRQSRFYKEFEETGKIKRKGDLFAEIFGGKEKEEVCTDNRRILLFDAIDSGLSIDGVCEVKEFLKLIMKKAEEEKGIEYYIIAVANEYELANGENCFDVVEGKYITFEDYEDYKKFILNSRKKKEKRIEKAIKWAEKLHEKELAKYEKFKQEVAAEREEYTRKIESGEESASYWILDHFNDRLADYRRHCRTTIKDDFKFDNSKYVDEHNRVRKEYIKNG